MTHKPAPSGDAFRHAVAQYQAGRLAEAAKLCQAILEREPANPSACHLFGLIAYRQGKLNEAETHLSRAIELDGSQPAPYNDLGVVLKQQDRLDEALHAYGHALRLKPDFAEAHNNRGNVLLKQGRHPEALAAFDQALRCRPNYADVYNNRGLLLLRQNKLEEAFTAFRQALDISPDYAEAQYNLALTLRALGRTEDALAASRRALALRPDYVAACAELASLTQQLCLWDELDPLSLRINATVEAGSGDITPFVYLALPHTSARNQLRCARQYAAKHLDWAIRLRPRLGFDWSRSKRERLKLGYLSANFQEHAMSSLIAGTIEEHDRSAFEVIGYSYGPDDDGPMRRRLVKAFDRFVDLRELSIVEAARRIHADGVGILVDLMGYTKDARPEIPALRPAPIQVSLVGYPGSMGVDFIDYLITDSKVTPARDDAYFSEKLVFLPDCYQPNDRRRQIGESPRAHAECGLPQEAFVLCCFNNVYKITPEVFDVWMRLLKGVPASVLWLLVPDTRSGASRHLRIEAQRRGVAPDRLMFTEPRPWPEYLARLRLADLFLDTTPVNAHTTASDALWAGLPLLTCRGRTFASRVAGSLLYAAGLPELVTDDLREYEATALRLARDPEALARLRTRLETTRLTAPLFDCVRHTRHLETAYRRMWELYAAGAPPSHIDVARGAGKLKSSE